MLHSHDITALIRDTEAHERALFTLQAPSQGARPPRANVARRTTLHGLHGNAESYDSAPSLVRNPRQGSTVATLLGGSFGEQIRKETSKEGRERGELDVNLLLKGAETLCGI